jgi:hypothetical protein
VTGVNVSGWECARTAFVISVSLLYLITQLGQIVLDKLFKGAAHQQAARGLPNEGLPQRSQRPRAGEDLQRQLLLWVLPQ